MFRCIANTPWRDVSNDLKNDGHFGFHVALKEPIAKDVRSVEIRREEDGKILGWPRAVGSGAAFDGRAREEWLEIFASAQTDEDFEERLTFLLSETEKLRIAYAQRKSNSKSREQRRRLRWAGETIADAGEAPRVLFIDATIPDQSRDVARMRLFLTWRRCKD